MCFMDHKSQTSIGESLPNKVMDGKATKPKEKRRNNEKRKEKSRDAARCRRSRESEIFNELGETLPVRKEDLENLDKASVMRLAIATLRVENMLELFKLDSVTNDPLEDQIFSNFDENAVTKALDGFLLVLSPEGDVTYVSENIHEYIGIQQIDLIGNPIWDYTHQCDHTELRDMLKSRHFDKTDAAANVDEIENQRRNVLIRVKCTLTSRGRNVNIKSASYKVLNIVGHTVMDKKENHHQFIGIARLVPHPSNIEVPLDSKTFLSKHTLNMKFSYVDDKMLSILGYKPTDLLDKSVYECHHGADSEVLMASFKNVINKGQTETPQYRFLGRNGGYCWVVSQATLVYDKQKPQSVVCVNYVISELTNENEVYSLRQLEAFNALSQNDKLKIQERAAAEKNKVNEPATFELKKEPFKEETEIIEKYSPVEFEQPKEIEYPVVAENPIRRVFVANPAVNGASTASPKAVTASVFKSLPTGKGALKHKLNALQTGPAITPANGKQIETSKPFMRATYADTRDSFGKTNSIISEPSILPRHNVVTASLFQPLRKEIITSNLLTANKTDLRAADTMNNDLCQTTCADNIFLQWEINNHQPQNKLINTQILNIPPTMKHLIFDTDMQQMQTGKSSPSPLNTNHKRCSTQDVGTTKRLKSNPISNFDLGMLNSMNVDAPTQPSNQSSELQQKSHLLQQLMAPTPQRVGRNPCNKKPITENNVNGNQQWLQNVGCDRLRNQSSDSVLKNLLYNNGIIDASDTFIGEITTNDCYDIENILKQQEDQTELNDAKNENDQNNMDCNMYGLVEDIFLVNSFNTSFDGINDPSKLFVNNDDGMKEVITSSITEKKPLESFEKQITISVTQPPPLKAEAFTIGGGLFDGITDHTNILPASLISPMDRNVDCNSYDMMRMNNDDLMDIWVPDME